MSWAGGEHLGAHRLGQHRLAVEADHLLDHLLFSGVALFRVALVGIEGVVLHRDGGVGDFHGFRDLADGLDGEGLLQGGQDVGLFPGGVGGLVGLHSGDLNLAEHFQREHVLGVIAVHRSLIQRLKGRPPGRRRPESGRPQR